MKAVIVSIFLLTGLCLYSHGQTSGFDAAVKLIKEKIFQADTASKDGSTITGIDINKNGWVVIYCADDPTPDSMDIVHLAEIKSIFCESCGIEQVSYTINFYTEIVDVIDEVDETGQILSIKKLASLISIEFKSVKDATAVAKAFIELQKICAPVASAKSFSQ